MRCAPPQPARAGPDDRTPDSIREAVRQVLAEPSYRANARAFQAEMMALPGPEEMVELLESLRPPGRGLIG
jgi:UDP:flavonoid glycosyltransferase YjiC (YdhE family)